MSNTYISESDKINNDSTDEQTNNNIKNADENADENIDENADENIDENADENIDDLDKEIFMEEYMQMMKDAANFYKKDIPNYSIFGRHLGLSISSFNTENLKDIENNFVNNIGNIIANAGFKLTDFAGKYISLVEKFVNFSYMNDITSEIFFVQVLADDETIAKIKLKPHNICLPFECKNSNIFYDECTIKIDNNSIPNINENLLSNNMTIIGEQMNSGNKLLVYSEGINLFTEKKNTCILFDFTKTSLQSSHINVFTNMYYSVLLSDIFHNEEEIMNFIADKLGFSVHSYDYFRNDYYYHYALYNNPLFYTGHMQSSTNYQQKCSRISAKIYFLWNLIYYYANMNSAFKVDIYFSIKFFKCMYDNLDCLDTINVDKINNVFPELLLSSLDTTIQYWIGKIREATNITNIFILQHVFELLDYDISLLIKNDVEVLKEKNIDFNYYTKKLNTIFADVDKIHKLHSFMVSHYYGELPLGVSDINTDYNLVPLHIKKSI